MTLGPINGLLLSPARKAMRRLELDLRLFRGRAAKQGLGSALAHTASVLSWRFYPPRRRFADNLRAEQARALEFDRLHHVETAREVFLKDSGVSQADAERGNGLYRAVWPRIFGEAIRSVVLDHSRFTFADYGAGKGMAMFLAAEYPFKKIVGVEFAPALHAIAKRNLTTYRSSTQRCFDLSVVLGDASTWQPPDGPLLCFFFNPFDPRTMQKALRNIIDSHRASPREIYLLYVNTRNVREGRRAFVGMPELTRVSRSRNHVSFKLN
jgi:hypothetical protein